MRVSPAKTLMKMPPEVKESAAKISKSAANKFCILIAYGFAAGRNGIQQFAYLTILGCRVAKSQLQGRFSSHDGMSYDRSPLGK